MTIPPRKPSDDHKLWQGVPVTQANRRFLFDVLGLVMSDMKRKEGSSPPMSFQQFREMVYGHMDALAREINASPSLANIDNQFLKTRMDVFLGLKRDRTTWPADF